MTAVDVAALEAARAAAAELLYPGMFADEAYRRHPQQVDRVAAVIVGARALRENVEAVAEFYGVLGQSAVARQVSARLRDLLADVDGGQR